MVPVNLDIIRKPTVAQWATTFYLKQNLGAGQSQPVDHGVLTTMIHCAIVQGKKSPTELILFNLVVSSEAVPYSVT